MKPVLAEVESEFAGKLVVAEVDVDAEESLARRFDVRSIPALLLFVDGRLVAQLAGARSKNALVADLLPHLGRP